MWGFFSAKQKQARPVHLSDSQHQSQQSCWDNTHGSWHQHCIGRLDANDCLSIIRASV